MYGIEKSVYNHLMNYFKQHDFIVKVTLFGSRAKNMAAYNSDIDLCISAKGNQKAEVKEEIDELVGIYSCDVVFCDELNAELKQQITRDGVVIYHA
ncbi:nucleotidyltransferase domain-containing protein [Lentibacillus daqui]|uniref:nucleotidyltransferase domain-containing protein n=1 Tax=Lentibacillus daqui TaxID=2911514 RepID=UPI0022B08A7A|nr:nucleotidyltransferase domain-containing protein [Lentibacillus daqui]